MQRYMVEQKNWSKQDLYIDGNDYHHIVNVMRMEPGDEVICNHPKGRAYLCAIDDMNDQNVRLTILQELEDQTELPVRVTLMQGLPKGDKLDWVVQKTTELGVATIIPLICERSIVKWDEKKQRKKVGRLIKIAKEASEQSHRSIQPTVENPVSIKQLLSSGRSFDHKFVAYEETTRKLKTNKLESYLNKIKPGQSIGIVIGPEGGLTEKEIEHLYQFDYHPVRLGPRILRTETAPLYLMSILSYLFEESD